VTWIYDYPTWLLAPLLIIGMCAISGTGLLLVLRYGSKRDTITHNDVAGPVLATAGTTLAVLLSFMVVAVWQEFDQSASNVQREANAVASLHQIAAGFSPAFRDELRSKLDSYINALIDDEWTKMQHGGESATAHRLAYDIEGRIVTYRAPTPSTQLLHAKALDLAETLVDARRQRLHDNETGIPSILWISMVIVAGITIVMLYLCRVDNYRAHMIMTTGLTVVIGLVFVLIAELDYPFRGDTHLEPKAFIQVRATLHDFP
jgi:hypothetical protein